MAYLSTTQLPVHEVVELAEHAGIQLLREYRFCVALDGSLYWLPLEQSCKAEGYQHLAASSKTPLISVPVR